MYYTQTEYAHRIRIREGREIQKPHTENYTLAKSFRCAMGCNGMKGIKYNGTCFKLQGNRNKYFIEL